MIKHINSDNFESEVLNSKKVTLVDFFVFWCGPCKMLAPVLEEIANSRDDFDIAKVNVDEAGKLASDYEIEVVPTMIIFKNGQVMEQFEGFYEKNDIIKLVEKYM